jgi:hypothetical protein
LLKEYDMRAALLLIPIVLMSCGPVSLPQAERACVERARLAEKPKAEVFIGINNKGEVLRGGSFGVSTDYLAGRDPAAVYTQCVKSRSGQFPTRSYTEFPR